MDTITNRNGQLVSCDGENAVRAFGLRSLIAALELEQKGMKLSRNRSALSIAKTHTGLRTRDRQQHIDRLRVMCNELLAKCNIINE